MIAPGVLRRLAAVPALFRRSPDPGRIIAICHCHHVDLVPELARTLAHLPTAASLHVTSSREMVLDAWRDARGLPMELTLHRVENRGRDIRPFFEVARALAIDAETLVLKIHGKRSDYSEHGRGWRHDLLDGLLLDRRTPGQVAERFRTHTRLGMLGAPRSFISHPVYWGRNRMMVGEIMRQGFGVVPSDDDLGFFAGSMFWMRGALLKDLLPHVDLDAFEPEPLPQDGSYAHAIERIIGMAAFRMGWEAGEIGRPDRIDPGSVRERKLPYI